MINHAPFDLIFRRHDQPHPLDLIPRRHDQPRPLGLLPRAAAFHPELELQIARAIGVEARAKWNAYTARHGTTPPYNAEGLSLTLYAPEIKCVLVAVSACYLALPIRRRKLNTRVRPVVCAETHGGAKHDDGGAVILRCHFLSPVAILYMNQSGVSRNNSAALARLGGGDAKKVEGRIRSSRRG